MRWLFDTTGYTPFTEPNHWPQAMRVLWMFSNVSISLSSFALFIALSIIWTRRRNNTSGHFTYFVFCVFLFTLSVIFFVNIMTIYVAPWRFIVAVRCVCSATIMILSVRIPQVVLHLLKLPSRELIHDLNTQLNRELLIKYDNEQDLQQRNKELRVRIGELELMLENAAWMADKSNAVQKLREMLLTVGGPDNGARTP